MTKYLIAKLEDGETLADNLDAIVEVEFVAANAYGYDTRNDWNLAASIHARLTSQRDIARHEASSPPDAEARFAKRHEAGTVPSMEVSMPLSEALARQIANASKPDS